MSGRMSVVSLVCRCVCRCVGPGFGPGFFRGRIGVAAVCLLSGRRSRLALALGYAY